VARPVNGGTAMRMATALCLCLSSLSAVAACSSAGPTRSSSTPGDDTGGDSGLGTGADGGAEAAGDDDGGAYPPGPYGSAMGFTLNDFQADGYRLTPGHTDSTKLPWSTGIDVAEYHRNPACKCLLITVGATWCGGCMVEQPTLAKEVAADPSFCVMGILQDGLDGGQEVPATRQDVDVWTQMFQQDFTVVQGNDMTMYKLIVGNGTGNSLALPFSLIVRPDTMKIVGHITGVIPSPHDYAMPLCAQ
jgi:hypothetical protein